MSKRFDVCAPRQRKGQEKTFWHRCGTAFEDEKGTTVYLDSLPLPDSEGRVVLKLFEARAKQQTATQGGTDPQAPLDDDLNDSAPF